MDLQYRNIWIGCKTILLHKHLKLVVDYNEHICRCNAQSLHLKCLTTKLNQSKLQHQTIQTSLSLIKYLQDNNGKQ